MAIGVNWQDIWGDVWGTVWRQEGEAAATTFTGHYWPRPKKGKRGRERLDDLRDEATELRGLIERSLRGEPVKVPPASTDAPPAPAPASGNARPTLGLSAVQDMAAQTRELRAQLSAMVAAREKAKRDAEAEVAAAEIQAKAEKQIVETSERVLKEINYALRRHRRP